MPVRRWVVVGLVLVLQAGHARAADPRGAALPARFRDLKMYSTSRPGPKDPGVIVVTTAVRNEGKKPLDVRAVLDPNDQAGFRGSEFHKRLAPGQSLDWVYEVRPPDGFRRTVLRGQILIGRHR